MRRIVFNQGEYYHISNRGVDKRVIFGTKGEYERFLACMYLFNDSDTSRVTETLREIDAVNVFAFIRSQQLVAIGAFVLLPTHFHMLVTPLVEGGVSKFMQRLQTSYTMYFNQKHQRSGSLFEGTFKAEHVETDARLKYLFAYVHLSSASLVAPAWKKREEGELNKLRGRVMEYPYGSAREYGSKKFVVVDPAPFPRYFKQEGDFESWISLWLNYKNQEENESKPRVK